MGKSTGTDGATLLRYTLIPAQTPLSAGEAGYVTVCVEPPENGQACCQSLEISCVVGGGQGALYADAPCVTTDSADWTVNYVNALHAPRAGHDTTAKLVCAHPKQPFVQTLCVDLSGLVDGAPGSYEILVRESACAPGGTFAYRTTALHGLKGRAPFYLNDFHATLPDSPTAARTEFDQGQPFVLSWHSNGDFYRVFTRESGVPLYEGTLSTCTVGAGLTRDATFSLQASKNVGARGAHAYVGDGDGNAWMYAVLPLTVSQSQLNVSKIYINNRVDASNANTILFGSGTQIVKAGTWDAPQWYTSATDGLLLLRTEQGTAYGACRGITVQALARQQVLLPVVAAEPVALGCTGSAACQWISFGNGGLNKSDPPKERFTPPDADETQRGGE